MFLDLILCVLGLAILVYAADKLVESASNLALNFGVSKMVIGLTIVAAGTSLPEFVVSLNSSIKGNAALSLGNVVGSNIMNIALILGITALILPINGTKEMVKREVPIMIAVTALVWIFAKTDFIISPSEGLILLAIFIVYNVLSYVIGKREAKLAEEYEAEANQYIMLKKKKVANSNKASGEDKSEKVSNENEAAKTENNANASDEAKTESESKDSKEEQPPSIGVNLLWIAGGLVGMVIGSELLVRSAVSIATALGVSNEVIGLTLVAIGTSLPELATSVVAAKKGQSDLSVGNVLGSNIFNITAIVSTAAIVPYFTSAGASSLYLRVSEEMLTLHIPIMMVVAIILLPIMITDMKISRKEGAFFLAIYLCYTIMLVQSAVKPNKPEEKQVNTIQENSIAVPASSTLNLKTN